MHLPAIKKVLALTFVLYINIHLLIHVRFVFALFTEGNTEHAPTDEL